MDKIPTGAWVVVADGGKARIFSNVGKDGAISLQQACVVEPKDLDNDGPSGHVPAEASASHIDEATFAKQLANRLNLAALKHEYAHLVLIADPQTLGQMRPQLHVETTRRMVGELAKTLTNSPVDDIEKSLRGAA